MEFIPRTEREIAESKLWTKGIYDFEISEASEKLSKSSGRPMIELKVKIFRPDGTSRHITDFLLEKRAEKLRHAADACGVLEKYLNGALSDQDFLNKRGKLKLGIEKDKTNTYPDKNAVLDYVCSKPKLEGGVDFSSFTK